MSKLINFFKSARTRKIDSLGLPRKLDWRVDGSKPPRERTIYGRSETCIVSKDGVYGRGWYDYERRRWDCLMAYLVEGDVRETPDTVDAWTTFL